MNTLAALDLPADTRRGAVTCTPVTEKSEDSANRKKLLALSEIDLGNVRRKLQKPTPEGMGWDEKCCQVAERWYRRFWTLKIKYPSEKIVPNKMIDMFWHHHILDTKAYAGDCHKVFGCFVHHNPYFGMNGDAVERDLAFVRTNELFRQEFGEDPTSLGNKALECSMDCGWVDPY